MKARYNATDNTLTELSDYSAPPDRPNVKFYGSSQQEMYQRHLEAWHIVMQDYNRGKAEYEKLLRTIPGHESCRSVFKDQQVYEEGKDYQVSQMSISIYAEPGTKMKVLFKDGLPANGSDYQQKEAAKYLNPETEYELARADVYDWSTSFYLKEFPGRAFNSVHFFSPMPVASPLVPVKSEDKLWNDLVNKVGDSLEDSKTNEEIIAELKKHFTLTPALTRLLAGEPGGGGK